ncbi:MAG: transglutaminase family protein, partial [Phycisphaerae bacterium]|nr:transglutaminase family protein [Phycisphaerae bacterium]
MHPRLPVCCRPEAFDLLSHHLTCIASPDGLMSAAVAVSMHELGEVDIDTVDRALQVPVNEIRKRVRGDQPQAILAHMHEVLFDELKFGGNSEEYYTSANSYLPTVLKTHRGLPITLSLVYKIVAERVGLRVHGVGLPGHFI